MCPALDGAICSLDVAIHPVEGALHSLDMAIHPVEGALHSLDMAIVIATYSSAPSMGPSTNSTEWIACSTGQVGLSTD